jgi:hypothetical protein
MVRAIDSIRTGIDKDLLKYHGATLCDILKAHSIKGIGLTCLVSRHRPYIDPVLPEASKEEQIKEGFAKQEADYIQKKTQEDRTKFMVVCINKPKTWFGTNIPQKYFALVFDVVKDKPTLAPAFLIPKSSVEDLEDWTNEAIEQIEREYEENIVEDNPISN